MSTKDQTSQATTPMGQHPCSCSIRRNGIEPTPTSASAQASDTYSMLIGCRRRGLVHIATITNRLPSTTTRMKIAKPLIAPIAELVHHSSSPKRQTKSSGGAVEFAAVISSLVPLSPAGTWSPASAAVAVAITSLVRSPLVMAAAKASVVRSRRILVHRSIDSGVIEAACTLTRKTTCFCTGGLHDYGYCIPVTSACGLCQLASLLAIPPHSRQTNIYISKYKN